MEEVYLAPRLYSQEALEELMKKCCEGKEAELTLLGQRQRGVLWKVLSINAVMFLIEIVVGWLAHSTALMADSLDMLGDATVYAFSLIAISKAPRWRSTASLLKGIIMAALGIGVLWEAFYKIAEPILPVANLMWGTGFLALSANTACLMLLWRHREDDINMRSTWICSRNDIIANTGVLFAALFVWTLKSRWPDIIVGGGIAILFLRSAYFVLRESIAELRTEPVSSNVR